MKTTAFIPIKLNSQRLPHKNILPLGDKPLCWHIANTAQSCKEIDDVYIFCSDPSIMKYMPDGVKLLIRDKKLDQDLTKGLEIYKSFVDTIESDVYVLMHATAPFLRSESVDDAIKKMKQDGFDSALSVETIQTFVWYDGKPLNYSLRDVPRTQDIMPVFVETSGFYAFEKGVIKQGRRIGDNPYFKIIDHFEAIDIDNKEDYDLACCVYDHVKT